MLIEYVRDENRVPYAAVVAVNRDLIGVSVCNPKDKFNKWIGVEIAQKRALLMKPTELPAYRDKQINKIVLKMKDRAARYFKPCESKVLTFNEH